MQSAVFDLDGTLLDTLADIAAACNTVLSRHAYPQHPLAAYQQMVGNGFDVLIERATPADRKPDASGLADLTREARQYYSGHMMERTRPYPGITEALQRLVDRGFKLGVLSNKPDEMTCALIQRYFPGLFSAVRGARPDLPLKPAPEALLRMLADFHSSRCCYIGDSNVDMQTAHNAHIYAVGVAWGFRGTAELVAAGADLIIDSPAQLGGLTIPTK